MFVSLHGREHTTSMTHVPHTRVSLNTGGGKVNQGWNKAEEVDDVDELPAESNN